MQIRPIAVTLEQRRVDGRGEITLSTTVIDGKDILTIDAKDIRIDSPQMLEALLDQANEMLGHRMVAPDLPSE